MEFKSYAGFEPIEVNEEGEFRWVKSKKPFNLDNQGKGYIIKFRLFSENYSKSLSPYKTIATLFVPNPNNYKFVVAIDGDYKNLKASNLMWVKCTRNKV